MHTWSYKGWWIHENLMSGRVEVQNPETFEVMEVVSVHAAKWRITREVGR